MLKKVLQTIYHSIPFKRSLFSFIKTFWTPPKRIYQHLYFKEDFTIKIDENHSFKMQHFGFELENELFWKGITGWETVSIDLWIKLCKKADVIFDVGANTGVFALIAKTIKPSAKVYAFEPVKRVSEKIHFNNQLNNFDINVIEKAAADFDGKGTIYDPMQEHVYSVTVNQNKNNPDTAVKAVEIETIKLASFIKGEGLEKVDLLKIDVESFEPEVLDGLGDYLVKYQPSMLIEILEDDIGRRIHEITKKLDYLYFKIENNARLTKTNELGNTIIHEEDDHNYFFCTPLVAKELKLI